MWVDLNRVTSPARNQLLAIPELQNKNPDHMILSSKTIVNEAGY